MCLLESGDWQGRERPRAGARAGESQRSEDCAPDRASPPGRCGYDVCGPVTREGRAGLGGHAHTEEHAMELATMYERGEIEPSEIRCRKCSGTHMVLAGKGGVNQLFE